MLTISQNPAQGPMSSRLQKLGSKVPVRRMQAGGPLSGLREGQLPVLFRPSTD